MSHVIVILLREWLRYVILDGLSIAQESLEQLCVAHLYICLHKYWLENNIIKRSILGQLER